MIKSFSCHNCTAEEFLGKIKANLAERNLGNMIEINSTDTEVKVIINKLGKSELVYDLHKKDNGFECFAKSEKIAFAHKPLRKEIEQKFSGVLKKLGATVEQS